MIITKASYIGKPVDNSVMFITKKVGDLIENLYETKGCLVFAEVGVAIPKKVLKNNKIIYTKNPQKDYAAFVNRIYISKANKDKNRKYCFQDNSYIGENVVIGENSFIENGCLIDHDVVIGKNALIKTGSVIRNSIIGDNFISCENCTIGTFGFNMAEDENGNKIRIATLGKVIIGNNVEINALTNISCGSAGDTIIDDYVKIDSLVHIGHDVHIHKNAEITAGTVLAGFSEIGEGAFVGINSAIKNRKKIGNNTFVGMGSVVTKDIEGGVIVIGNPAKEYNR